MATNRNNGHGFHPLVKRKRKPPKHKLLIIDTSPTEPAPVDEPEPKTERPSWWFGTEYEGSDDTDID
jgi:hypothetical protein